MLRQSLVLLAAVAAAGCGTDMFGPSDSGRLAAQAPTGAELAAYAGSRRFPATQPADNSLRAAAIVNHAQGVVKIYNFSDQPIQDADIWVNRSYVEHVRGIAPSSAPMTIRFADLYNGLGQRFSSQNGQIRSVQIESNGKLYTLEGPGVD